MEYSKSTLFRIGITMGIADAIPGVSGGTVAYFTGIYDNLLAAISSCKKLEFRKCHLSFLLPLLSGIFIGLVGFAQIVHLILKTSSGSALLFAFLFGLAGTLFFPFSFRSLTIKTCPWLIFGCIIAFFLAFQAETVNARVEKTVSFWVILSGALAAIAMLLPGISGSAILCLCGLYVSTLEAVATFSFGFLSELGFGIILGLVFFSDLILWVLKKFRQETEAFLKGMMLGSLKVLFSFVDAYQMSLSIFVCSLALALFGATLSLLFAKRTSQFEFKF